MRKSSSSWLSGETPPRIEPSILALRIMLAKKSSFCDLSDRLVGSVGARLDHVPKLMFS